MFPSFTQEAPRMHGWRGQSGECYWFSACRLNEIYDFEGIVYILVRARPDGYFVPLYIGQSGEGNERLRPSKHEKLPAAQRLGLTHVHVHFVGNRAKRFAVETDLRRRHSTPLNEQATPASTATLGDLGGPFGYGGGIGGSGLAALLAAPAPPTRGLAEPPLNSFGGLGFGGSCSLLDSGLDALLWSLSKRS